MERSQWTDARLDDRFDHIDSELGVIRGELRELRADVRHGADRTDALGADLRGEIGTLGADLRGEIGTLGGDLRGEIGGVRGELGELRAAIDDFRVAAFRVAGGMTVALIAAILIRGG